MDLISVEQEEGSKFKVQVRHHRFTSDMSVQDGGKDEAPSPAYIVVGALGACIGMAIHRYCASHGFASEQISLDLTFQLDTDPMRIKNITIDINLPRDFPKERRRAILKVAEACPVHSTLRIPPEIDIELVGED